MMNTTKKLVTSGLLLALCLVLPFLTGQIPQIGSMLCPMHVPVLLCGFICGWKYGLAVGFIAPLLRYGLFGMPPMPVCLAMAFELAAYGAVSGLMYTLLPRRSGYIYVSLLAAMVAGRLVWGLAQLVITGIAGTQFSFGMFLSGAVLTALPGIAVQIILIPIIVLALKRAKLISVND